MATVRPRQVVRVRVAGFWRRAAAGAIDALLLIPVFGLLGLLLALLVGGRIPRLREIGVDYVVELVLGHDPLVIGGVLLCLVVGLLYHAIFLAVAGRTFGKQAMGLRVIMANGERPDLWRSIGRQAACALAILLFSLGIIWIAFDREKRGLHDWIAGTYVVRG